jgi:uncharacterized protein
VITIDANIYVSAIAFGGKPGILLLMAIDGDVDLAISEPILDEVLRVLRVKFGHSDQELAEAETRIRSFTYMVEPVQGLNVVSDDPDDNRVIEFAVASGPYCIVTGDKDLLRLGRYEAIQMVRLADFLTSIESSD